ncbi:AMP-binding protein [Actinomadura montaniterrae]|uniref:AMP-binding protein n=1 Tax=Actinomadura montaniterrae TaxID=1803903 RepID=A0A6L3W0X2_9ACTN|nr:AMP-binding protein [Actinomadura montaniterrae]
MTPIGDLLTAYAADADRPAVTCDGHTRTYGELESRANRLARAYEALGVGRGDFVTVALPNGIEFFEVCYAIWKLGATPQPVSPRLPGPELSRIIKLAGPALVVGAAADGTPAVPPGFEPDAALADTPLGPRVAPAWKATTSGGSTGSPKLIVAGRGGAVDPDAFLRPFMLRRGQVALVPGPLYHNAPFLSAFGGTFLGQHVIVLPKFDARRTLEEIERHRVTYLALVPTMMLRILRILDAEPGGYDVSSLDAVLHTAAPCPPWLKRRWIDLVGPEHLFEAYGGTEGQAFTVISGSEWAAHPGSVGRPVVGEIKVIGRDGDDEAPPGEVGRVVMRRSAGSGPAYRYIGAEARRYEGGWESLGDMGWLDEDGYLYLADRDTDMLLVGGANVYPAEVEAAISEHPSVLSCAVVGLPDDDLGQRPHAVVQTDPAADLTIEDLRAFVEQRLVRYKVPRSFRFVTEALRDDAGKLRRGAVQAEETARLTEARLTEDSQ